MKPVKRKPTKLSKFNLYYEKLESETAWTTRRWQLRTLVAAARKL